MLLMITSTILFKLSFTWVVITCTNKFVDCHEHEECECHGQQHENIFMFANMLNRWHADDDVVLGTQEHKRSIRLLSLPFV